MNVTDPTEYMILQMLCGPGAMRAGWYAGQVLRGRRGAPPPRARNELGIIYMQIDSIKIIVAKDCPRKSIWRM